MTVLITGATGLLGSHLIDRGFAAGKTIRALIGPNSAGQLPAGSRLALCTNEELRRMDVQSTDLLSDSDHFESIMKDVSTVIHCAGWASPFRRDLDKMRAIHLGGTVRLFEAARNAGVTRWIQISSVATLCNGETRHPVDESAQGHCRPTAYAETKLEADRWLEAHRNEMNILWIHPTFLLGRWDSRPSSGALLSAFRAGLFRFFLNREKNFVAASDVANGIWSAVDRNATGHYILGNENLKLSAFFDLLASRTGFKSIRPTALQEIDELKRHLSGDLLELVLEHSLTGPVLWQKARLELGYHPRVSPEAMIDETAEHFRC